MGLSDMEARGELVGQASTPEELASLVRMAGRRAGDAALEQLSPESRIVNAYQCILACAKAVLRALDYRVPDAMNQHYLTIETLRHTLRLDERKLRYFQVLRRKRHEDEYKGTLEASEQEAEEASREAQAMLEIVRRHLDLTEDEQ